ncbi:MAG: dienelactone hydrolase family protein [Nitrospiria bacterium]
MIFLFYSCVISLFLFFPASLANSEPMTNDKMMSDEMMEHHILKADSNHPLKGKEITEKLDGKTFHAYLSQPGGNGPFPSVIMIHEWWGLNKNIKEYADKLAKDGFVVLAVDLYKGKVVENREEAARLMGEVKPAEAIEILKTAYQWLKKNPLTKDGKVGTVGWCFGGGYSLQAGLNLPKVDAVVIYYGLLETDPNQLARLKGPVLGIFADKDGWINPKMVNDFENGLKQAKVVYAIHKYDADHAFANPSNPQYDPKAEADAWAKTVAFFNQNLKNK